ncbi:MAG: phytanoyl-CoA dioxygenase family protein [Planctomycetota bacterium]
MLTVTTHTTELDFLHDGWSEEYWTKGYTILRRVFNPSDIQALDAAFNRAYEEGMSHPKTWRHRNRVIWLHEHQQVGKFITGCQWQSWADPVLDRFRTDPRMLAILEPLIGDHLNQITNQMHWRVPGTGHSFALHQDVRSRTPAHQFRDLYHSYAQTGIAVDRHWSGSGAMKFLPYSHLRGNLMGTIGATSEYGTKEVSARLDEADRRQLIDVEMEPGDVAVWNPFTVHGGGINTTADNFRRLYINGYVKADHCDRGQPVFHHGRPVPLVIPALAQYEDLYVRPDPHYPDDAASKIERD